MVSNMSTFFRLCLLVFLCLGSLDLLAQKDSVDILVINLDAEIDPRTNRLMELGLEKATELDVDYVVIEMDTYGGALDDADDIRTMVLEFEKPIYVFINKDAASAGALISIACDSIYMAAGASIGAATVVTQDGTAAPDKYQSYMRSIMRSTAEATGRDPHIAEAMVDETIEVDGISATGKVITFSTSEAIKHGFCEAQVRNVDEVMARSGVETYEEHTFELSASDKIISLFINPFVSGILIMIIIGGIYFELQTPGVGFPILASLIAMILYFIPYYMNGLAEYWELSIFFVGLVLIALEVFVIPGFGVAGIAGITMTSGSLLLIMLNNDMFDFSFVPDNDFIIAIFTIFLSLGGSVVVVVLGYKRFSQSSMFKRVALVSVMDSKDGYTANFKTESLLGKKGIAYTILRPSGKIMIDEEVHDAYTRGEYIEKDSSVEVIGQEANFLKVKSIKPE